MKTETGRRVIKSASDNRSNEPINGKRPGGATKKKEKKKIKERRRNKTKEGPRKSVGLSQPLEKMDSNQSICVPRKTR